MSEDMTLSPQKESMAAEIDEFSGSPTRLRESRREKFARERDPVLQERERCVHHLIMRLFKDYHISQFHDHNSHFHDSLLLSISKF
jgi:hypothetical protein